MILAIPALLLVVYAYFYQLSVINQKGGYSVVLVCSLIAFIFSITLEASIGGMTGLDALAGFIPTIVTFTFGFSNPIFFSPLANHILVFCLFIKRSIYQKALSIVGFTLSLLPIFFDFAYPRGDSGTIVFDGPGYIVWTVSLLLFAIYACFSANTIGRNHKSKRVEKFVSWRFRGYWYNEPNTTHKEKHMSKTIKMETKKVGFIRHKIK